MLEAVYELLVQHLSWPTFKDLDRIMDRRGEPDVESALLAMPSDLIYGVSPRQTAVQDHQEIALTTAGLALCEGSDKDLDAFIRAIRLAAALEQRVEAREPDAELDSDLVAREILPSDKGQQESVKRLGAVLRNEHWGWTGASHNEERWSFTIGRRVRRFRDVSSIDDYWHTLHPEAAEPGPTDRPEASHEAGDLSEDALAIFVSYSHDDKEVARSLASALRARGVRVWVDEGELRAGDSIVHRVASAIEDVHFVVAIVSNSSIASDWCTKELGLAVTRGLGRSGAMVLPLRLGEVRMPAPIKDLYYLTIDPADLEGLASRLIDDARSHQSDRNRPHG